MFGPELYFRSRHQLHRIMAMDTHVFTWLWRKAQLLGYILPGIQRYSERNLSVCHFGHICGEQSGTETGISWRTSVALC